MNEPTPSIAPEKAIAGRLLHEATLPELGMAVIQSARSYWSQAADKVREASIKFGFNDIELHAAVHRDDVKRAAELLHEGLSPSGMRGARHGWTPLMAAINEHHEQMTELLLTATLAREPAMVNARDEKNLKTPAHVAAESANWAAYKLLANSGKANLNMPDIALQTPVALMAAEGNAELLKLSVAAGANLNMKDANKWPVAFHVLAGNATDKTDMLEVIRRTGFDLNGKYGNDELPLLSVAVKYADKAVVSYLLNQPGVDVNAMNKHGYTPLHFAAASGIEGVTALLLQSGAEPNVLSKERPEKGQVASTPLIMAAAKGNLDAVDALTLSEKTHLMIPVPGTKDTALSYAESRGHDAVVTLLKDRIRESQQFDVRGTHAKLMAVLDTPADNRHKAGQPR